MSLQSVQQFFADNAPDIEVIELGGEYRDRCAGCCRSSR